MNNIACYQWSEYDTKNDIHAVIIRKGYFMKKIFLRVIDINVRRKKLFYTINLMVP